eukprot:gene250-445_t
MAVTIAGLSYLRGGEGDETIRRCLDFKDQALCTMPSGVKKLLNEYIRRPKCPCCHLEIHADALQQNSESCMVLRCDRCSNVFCGFCLVFSHDPKGVCDHATSCPQNPRPPLLRLPEYVSLKEHFKRLTFCRVNEPSIYGEDFLKILVSNLPPEK